MFNPLSLFTDLKGSLSTVLFLVGFSSLVYLGVKFYLMDSEIKTQNQTIKLQNQELKTKDEYFNKASQAYEISIIEVEQKAYTKALKKEIKESLAQTKKELKIEINKKNKEVLSDKDICSKCYADFLF